MSSLYTNEYVADLERRVETAETQNKQMRKEVLLLTEIINALPTETRIDINKALVAFLEDLKRAQ
jgi:hypothetical protein